MRLITDMRLAVLLVLFSILPAGCALNQNSLDSISGASNDILQDNGQGICLDLNSGKMWQLGRGGAFFSLQDAQQYAEDLQLGGYDDWRLPTKEELFDLHNRFFLKENGNCSMKRGGEYWSADKKGKPALGHWETYHLCGPGFKYVKSVGTKGYVRAIRKLEKGSD